MVEKKEKETSARLKQRLLIGDLVSGEEEESDEVKQDSSGNSSAYRSAHDASPAASSRKEGGRHADSLPSTPKGEHLPPSIKPHPILRSASAMATPSPRNHPSKDSTAPLNAGDLEVAATKLSSKKRKGEKRSTGSSESGEGPSEAQSLLSQKPLPSTPTSKPRLTPGVRKVEWPRTKKALLAVGLRLAASIFVVAFVASLIFPGIQWGSASSWLLSSLYIAIVSSVVRLFLSKHANATADSLILSIGGKISSRTSVIGDSILPALCMLVVQVLLLYSASWVFSDFYVTSWRSLVLHSAVSALSSVRCCSNLRLRVLTAFLFACRLSLCLCRPRLPRKYKLEGHWIWRIVVVVSV